MLIDKFVVRLMKRIVRCSTIIHSMYWKCPGTSIFHSFTQHRNTVPKLLILILPCHYQSNYLMLLTDVKKNVKCPTQTLTVCHIQ